MRFFLYAQESLTMRGVGLSTGYVRSPVQRLALRERVRSATTSSGHPALMERVDRVSGSGFKEFRVCRFGVMVTQFQGKYLSI